jgi:hypothetical protein
LVRQLLIRGSLDTVRVTLRRAWMTRECHGRVPDG